jgi:BirA family biotin operon repressor/biotin-[acetyl-CoA-carboxylase] ligase
MLLSDGCFHSGTELGERLGISRTAIWKHIKQLETTYGLDVQAVQGKGYRLSQAIELLDEETIVNGLSDESSQLLNIIEVHPQLESTNRFLMQQTDTRVSRVVLAEMQTAGRGRRGKSWVSPFGQNIYLSLLWHFDDVALNLSGVSLAVGVAVITALKKQGVDGLQLKWPNDIYWQGRKLGGILLELRGEAGGACDMVVGLGLNVKMSKQAAQDIDQAWVDLSTITTGKVSRNALVSNILCELLPCMQLYSQQGLKPFLAAWQENDMLKDRPVSLLLHQQSRQGIARGVNEQGALMLEIDGNLEAVYAGEVSLRLNQ